jgi:hypothetical protein
VLPDERTFPDTVGILEGADGRHSRFAKMKEAGGAGIGFDASIMLP